MIDKKNIIKMASHVFRRSQGYPDRRLIHPQREWAIGIFMFLATITLGSVLVSNIFTSYNDPDRIQAVPEDSLPVYRDIIVQDALELYRARTEEYKKLTEQKATTIVSSSTPAVLDIDIVPEEESIIAEKPSKAIIPESSF